MTDISGVHAPPKQSDEAPDPKLVRAVWLVAIMGVGVVLYFAQDVFIPVAMALFLALLLTPAVDRLCRWRLRRGIAVAIVMSVVFAAAALAVNSVWTPASEWLARAPQTLRKIDPRLQPMREMFERYVSEPYLMPGGFHRRVSEGQSVQRVVCDYISGMTDRYALEQYKKLFDPDTW